MSLSEKWVRFRFFYLVLPLANFLIFLGAFKTSEKLVDTYCLSKPKKQGREET